jgi:hypothetical protein
MCITSNESASSFTGLDASTFEYDMMHKSKDGMQMSFAPVYTPPFATAAGYGEACLPRVFLWVSGAPVSAAYFYIEIVVNWEYIPKVNVGARSSGTIEPHDPTAMAVGSSMPPTVSYPAHLGWKRLKEDALDYGLKALRMIGSAAAGRAMEWGASRAGLALALA